MTVSGAKPVKMLIKNSSNQWVPFDGSITTGDIEIGAVEIKDHDGTDRLEITSANAAKVDKVSPTGTGDGVKTVSSAGTDEALAGSTACKRVIVQAQTDNTGLIAVGATGVDATEATGTGTILYPSDAIDIEIDNLADVYIDATVSGDGVRYFYFT